uniref:Uncharacterized protein n=1 Tax=Panagrolaimus sp. PS1159 TaxID=55785 RepID=A0AC35GG96_9BILA
MGSTAKDCYFSDVIVRNNDGSNASLAKIIDSFPLLEYFNSTNMFISSPNISKTTVKELLETSKFATLKQFNLNGISEDFDIESFYKFLKKNRTMDIHLHFKNNLSKNFCKTRKAVIKKILKLSNTKDFWPPCISTAQEERLSKKTLAAHERYSKKSIHVFSVVRIKIKTKFIFKILF